MPRLYLEKLREAKEGKIDFVMIGDSITHSWSKYPEAFLGSNLLNLGFPGIEPKNVLWRIRNGARCDLAQIGHPDDWHQPYARREGSVSSR